MLQLFITAIVLSAEPATQPDVTIDPALAQCIINCKAEAAKKPAARKGGGKKAAKPVVKEEPKAEAPARDPRVDKLADDVARLNRETAEHDEIKAEIKRNEERRIKDNYDTRVKAATDHVRQQNQLDDHKKRLDDHDSQLAKLKADAATLYGMYDKYNPFSARVGLSPGVLTLKSLDGTSYTGVSLSATLTLSLRNWAEAFGEGGFIGAVSDRPLSARARGGVNVFPLSWTKIPGIKDVGVQAALSINMLEVGERLKARSAFIMGELGPHFRLVLIERWLAFSAGLNLMGGLEFDQGHPAPAVGFAGHVAVEF